MAADENSRIVTATGVASASLAGNDDLAGRIEATMQQAIRECLDEGVTDPDKQRARMLAARDAVLSE